MTDEDLNPQDLYRKRDEWKARAEKAEAELERVRAVVAGHVMKRRGVSSDEPDAAAIFHQGMADIADDRDWWVREFRELVEADQTEDGWRSHRAYERMKERLRGYEAAA